MAHAGGKVILAGEHAVVYGEPALAVGLREGVEAIASPAEQPALWLDDRRCAESSDAFAGFTRILEALHCPPCQVHVHVSLPTGVGLGASAAIGVAVARAVLCLTEPNAAAEDQRILAAAHHWEAVFHGNASGIDATCAFHAGALHFRRDEGHRVLALGRTFELCIAVAGPASSTKAMVAQVAGIAKHRPQAFERTLAAIGTLVRNLELALSEGDLSGAGQLMDYNHMLLSGWLLSTPAIERACATARKAGALGTKLTGAGGGGCVVALVAPGESAPVLDAWQNDGFKVLCTRVGDE